MRDIEKRKDKQGLFGEPWGWRVALFNIGFHGGLVCMAIYFLLCPWFEFYSLGGNHYAADDGKGNPGFHISASAACRCIYLGRPLMVMGFILLPIGATMMVILIRRMNKRERERKSGNETRT